MAVGTTKARVEVKAGTQGAPRVRPIRAMTYWQARFHLLPGGPAQQRLMPERPSGPVPVG